MLHDYLLVQKHSVLDTHLKWAGVNSVWEGWKSDSAEAVAYCLLKQTVQPKLNHHSVIHASSWLMESIFWALVTIWNNHKTWVGVKFSSAVSYTICYTKTGQTLVRFKGHQIWASLYQWFSQQHTSNLRLNHLWWNRPRDTFGHVKCYSSPKLKHAFLSRTQKNVRQAWSDPSSALLVKSNGFKTTQHKQFTFQVETSL